MAYYCSLREIKLSQAQRHRVFKAVREASFGMSLGLWVTKFETAKARGERKKLKAPNMSSSLVSKWKFCLELKPAA